MNELFISLIIWQFRSSVHFQIPAVWVVFLQAACVCVCGCYKVLPGVVSVTENTWGGRGGSRSIKSNTFGGFYFAFIVFSALFASPSAESKWFAQARQSLQEKLHIPRRKNKLLFFFFFFADIVVRMWEWISIVLWLVSYESAGWRILTKEEMASNIRMLNSRTVLL